MRSAGSSSQYLLPSTSTSDNWQVQVHYQYKWSAGSSSQFGLTYKCCLSDSQLIKGGFPPKDFGQCWNFEYLGKVGIEKSNKKPKPKPKQHKKLPTSQWQTFFAKKNPGQRQKLKIICVATYEILKMNTVWRGLLVWLFVHCGHLPLELIKLSFLSVSSLSSASFRF